MKQTNYMQTLSKANTLEELTQIKESFLSECKKREQTILASNVLGQINDFCGAQAMFESMIVPLMGKKGGKALINKYTKVIKENKSLKTIYAYHEGLKENKTPDSKKAYITEALSLSTPVQYNEYVKGVGDIVSLISEAFKLLGNEYVIENVSYDNKAESIGSSLLYLSTTKKNIRNLNEYISHIDNVSENIVESKDVVIDVNLTLDEIVSEMTQKIKNTNVDTIFNTDNKEKTFCEAKDACLSMIKKQKEQTNDEEICTKLTEMESKLTKKQYTFETFTKDMLYMTELQEVLK